MAQVYNVSGWHGHPGGDVIFTRAGEDITDLFAAFHASRTLAAMTPFMLGDLAATDFSRDAKTRATRRQLDVERGYRALRARVRAEGLFDASASCYLRYQLTNVAILLSAAACAAYAPTTSGRLFGAVLLGLFLQQAGWLAHDFNHNQVFKKREMNHWFGVVWSSLAQGFSKAWWCHKHNRHHAAPNAHASSKEFKDGDPDIATMPFLAWSAKMAARAGEWRFGRRLIAHQRLTYFPLLALVRVTWLLRSCFFLLGGGKPLKNPRFEIALIALHYVWFGCIIAQLRSAWEMFAFATIANVSSSLFMAVVFALGHNGMAMYDADALPDFSRLQITTTRNIRGGPLVHWFCGGLQYQVEHHLFPQMPRHHLAAAHVHVATFCERFGITCYETSLWQGTKEVFTRLSRVTEAFLKQYPAM